MSAATALQFERTWEGPTKIIMGIDIGTTQSGVAFTILQAGANKTIHRVARWPGLEASQQRSKIPTLIWYDAHKKAVAFGAEALTHAIQEEAEDNGWYLAKDFKLHLHPNNMRDSYGIKLNYLPPGVSLRQIYSDFIGYLLKHTKAYFEDRIIDGRTMWERYGPEMEAIIAHPNGWGIREQAFLRTAAVDAGLSSSDRAPTKIRFVTEAEASVHFCSHYSNLAYTLQPGSNFAVCDAGGSTVDTTLYSVISTHPVLEIRETRASACVQAGAIFIDLELEKYLHRTLANAGLDPDTVLECTRDGVKDFEGMAKRAFKDETDHKRICLAGSRFNHPAIGIRRGFMTISGSIMKGFFDPFAREIIASVDQQLNGLDVPHILLVGGFGDSPYLRQEFRKRYESQGCQIASINDSTSKAVADGAVLWGVLHGMFGRTLRHSWGIETSVTFEEDNPDHQNRRTIVSGSGWTTVSGIWKELVKKGVPLDKANGIATIPFSFNFSVPSIEPGQFELDLYTYSGGSDPVWMKDKQGTILPQFRKGAAIKADLKHMRQGLEAQIGLGGKLHWQLDFDLCIRFHETELGAHLEWDEKGVKKTCPCACVSSSDNI